MTTRSNLVVRLLSELLDRSDSITIERRDDDRLGIVTEVRGTRKSDGRPFGGARASTKRYIEASPVDILSLNLEEAIARAHKVGVEG